MRFKIYYDETLESLNISCLTDNHTDTILPKDPAQHVHFPIPNDMHDNIKKELIGLLDADATQELREVLEGIKKLTDKRRDIVNNLRVKLNPRIIETCEKFKEDNAEFFI